MYWKNKQKCTWGAEVHISAVNPRYLFWKEYKRWRFYIAYHYFQTDKRITNAQATLILQFYSSWKTFCRPICQSSTPTYCYWVTAARFAIKSTCRRGVSLCRRRFQSPLAKRDRVSFHCLYPYPVETLYSKLYTRRRNILVITHVGSVLLGVEPKRFYVKMECLCFTLL